MRPYPISAADHIVLEKIGGLELLEDAFNKQGAGPREGDWPHFFHEYGCKWDVFK